MKKYLMMGVAAVTLASCSHDLDLYDQGAVDNLVVEKYKQAFIKNFGQPAPDQDWGFSAATTRAVVKPDMPAYPTENLPADVTAAEAAYVQEWFETHPGLSDEGLDISDFYIQYVSSKNENKKGMWHRYDQNRVNNGYDSNYWDEEFTDFAGMDYLVISNGKDYQEHVLDFNNYNSGSFGIVYIENGSALQWGYHSSWGDGSYAPNKDGIYYYFKLAEIDVPGVGKGWYIGLSVYGKKYDNGDKEIGIQRLDYAEDWIFKLVPANTKDDVFLCRVFAEDLSAEEAGDFDFNDVVFDVYTNNGDAKIVLQAAGGTLPLYVEGIEIHEAFGVATNVMVNTGAGANKGAVVLPTTVSGVYSAADVNAKIKVEVMKDKLYTLEAITGEPAAKFAVDDENVGWPGERTDIKVVYKGFEDWVTGGASAGRKWWKE